MPPDLRALVDRLADALGPNAPPEQVERVARAVLTARTGAHLPAEPARTEDGHALVLAFGPDRPGLLAAVSAAVAGAGASVAEVSAQRLGGFAALLLLVDLPTGTLPALNDRLRGCAGCHLAVAVETAPAR